MSGVLHGIVASLKAAAAAATDSFFKYVTLLLHGDGTNGAQNNTFLDGSTNAFTITRNGNTTQGSFSPFSQTGWSNYFDGTGDYLTGPNDAAFGFGTGDFTLECWVYCTTSSITCWLFDFRTATNQAVPCLYGYGTSFYYYVSGADRISVTGLPTIQNRWCHVAVARSGTSTKLFLNGEQIGSTWTDNTNYAQAAFKFGRNENGTLHISESYVSNIRIVKGTAVYTANFTPPTAPLTAIANTSLLTCQSNRFLDNSSNAFAITRNGDVRVEAFSPFNPSTTYSTSVVGGSGYFDGTGDYLTVPYSTTAFDWFTSGTDYTIEAWVYPNSLTGWSDTDPTMVGNMSPTGGTNYWSFGPISAGTVRFYYFNGSSISVTSIATISVGQWSHVAMTKTSSGITLFVNGKKDTTATIFGTPQSSTGVVLSIGSKNNTSANGYISNLRIVKGTAVYTADFTPPTAPLTAITNTSLLLNYTNGGIFDNASQTVLETVGNAQISTAQFKWGTGSMYFDGTGDWLTAIDRPALRFGTAAFTIECWLYLGATGAARGIVGKGTATTGWLLSTDASNKVVFTYGSSTITSTAALSGSTWYFLTVVREGTGTNQTKIYIDGTNDGTGTVSTDFNQTNILYVGADRTGGSAMNGYIDDLRITNGYARYTANFTPPTAAFPDN